MVSDIVKGRAFLYVSICWGSSVSLALTWLRLFYYAYVHVLAIIKTEFSRFGNSKGSEIMPDDPCPSSVSVLSDKRCCGSEDEKILHYIQTWDLARIFHTLDSNRDGMVSADDIKGLLEKLELQYFCDDNMKIIMGFQDYMGFDDFCRLCVSLWEGVQYAEGMQSVSEEGELRDAFFVFDKDGDGFIIPSELQEVLLSLRLGEGKDLENCATMITRFDKNSDGRIDFMEFQNMMTTINRP